MATSIEIEWALKLIWGINVPRNTALRSGLARNAAPTYDRRTSDNQRNTFRITVYDPMICKAAVEVPMATTSRRGGIGTSRFNAEAIPPMSAPASITFPTNSQARIGHNSQRGSFLRI